MPDPSKPLTDNGNRAAGMAAEPVRQLFKGVIGK